MACEHKYQILNDNTEIIFSDGRVYAAFVNTVFYCEKCLEVQLKEETIQGVRD